MQTALRLTRTVQPGGRVEIASPDLPDGKAVDIIVLLPLDAEGLDAEVSRRSVIDILAEAPGRLAFQTADEVEAYLREERDGWER